MKTLEQALAGHRAGEAFAHEGVCDLVRRQVPRLRLAVRADRDTAATAADYIGRLHAAIDDGETDGMAGTLVALFCLGVTPGQLGAPDDIVEAVALHFTDDAAPAPEGGTDEE